MRVAINYRQTFNSQNDSLIILSTKMENKKVIFNNDNDRVVSCERHQNLCFILFWLNND